MSSNVLQGSTKESIESRSGLHLSLGGVKVIGNFAEQAPKKQPFRRHFASLGLVFVDILARFGCYSLVFRILALLKLVLSAFWAVWLFSCLFLFIPELSRDGFTELRLVWRPLRAVLKSVRL